jgi:FkbM family methyltransferase
MAPRDRLAPITDRTLRRIARSPRGARWAAALRNQCELLIGYHFAPTDDMDGNGERWLLDQVGPTVSRFIDVGANVGGWSAALLQRAPDAQGLAIEPGHVAAERLRARGLDRVEVLEAAAGESAGRVSFHEAAGASEHSSAAAAPRATAAARTVPVVALDDVLEDRGWKHVDVLKIDTEGYDARALAGAGRALEGQRIATIQFEYNRPWRQAGTTLAGATALLEDAGYVVRVLRERGLERFDYDRYGEFFSYSNFVAFTSRSPLSGPCAEGAAQAGELGADRLVPDGMRECPGAQAVRERHGPCPRRCAAAADDVLAGGHEEGQAALGCEVLLPGGTRGGTQLARPGLELAQEGGHVLHVSLGDPNSARVPVDERRRKPVVADDDRTPAGGHRLEESDRRRPDASRTDDEPAAAQELGIGVEGPPRIGGRGVGVVRTISSERARVVESEHRRSHRMVGGRADERPEQIGAVQRPGL